MSNNQDNKRKGPRELCTGGEWIYGRKPVYECLSAARRTFNEVILPPHDKDEADDIAEIRAYAQQHRIVVRTEDRHRLDAMLKGGHHQGVALKTSGYPYVAFEDIVAEAENDENAFVLVLDHLEDPQNVGAILRTACAAGVTGVIIPEDRACLVTPAAVRASAGASEHIRVAHVVNLPRAIDALKKVGVWMTGLDWGEDAKMPKDIDFKGRVGLVVGAEGSGITRLVREKCDFIAQLSLNGFESLNASVAAGMVIYEVLRQQKGA